MKQRFFSLLFCWFIQAIIVPATQGTAIPRKQNSQTQWSTWNTTLLEEWAQNIMVHFRVAVTCVPQPGTCSAMPATRDDHVVRLQISSLGKAEIAIQCWNCVRTHLLIDTGFDSRLRKSESVMPPETVQLGTWLDHISACSHPQTSKQIDAECIQGTCFVYFGIKFRGAMLF